ncbi:MAG: M28 family peptidase [Candidatus Latescibacterota bacterium]
MDLDWHSADRWLMGEAWVGSQVQDHLRVLCDGIGERWSSSEGERRAVEYLAGRLKQAGLAEVGLEEFELDTWAWDRAEARVVEQDRPIQVLPFNRCPPFAAQGPIVDVGYGTPREVEAQGRRLRGGIAVMHLGFEPFTAPLPHAVRLRLLAGAGAAAAVAIDRKSGGRAEYHSASDWRHPGLHEHPLPTVTTTREDGALLRRLARDGRSLSLQVEARLYRAPSWNVVGLLPGSRWPEEQLVLGGHHDTVYGTPGGNDNATGVIGVLETARALARLQAETGVGPGCSLRFVTFAAEEQKFQGASAYAERHYGQGRRPRLVLNLDELSTGPFKGIVLAFPHLRDLVQHQLDDMGDGHQAHCMSQLDATSDHFPFLRAGLDAAFLWRWRFVGRHPDCEYHHEPADTADKVNVRELKEYVGQLARLLLRLSHVPPGEWPSSPVTAEQVALRLEQERDTVVRVM